MCFLYGYVRTIWHVPVLFTFITFSCLCLEDEEEEEEEEDEERHHLADQPLTIIVNESYQNY